MSQEALSTVEAISTTEQVMEAWWEYLVVKSHPSIYTKSIWDQPGTPLRTRMFSLVPSVAPELHPLRGLMPEAREEPNVYVEGVVQGRPAPLSEYLEHHDWFTTTRAYSPKEGIANLRVRQQLKAQEPFMYTSRFLLDIFVSDQWGRKRFFSFTYPPIHQRLYIFFATQQQHKGVVLDRRGGKPPIIRAVRPNEISHIITSFTNARDACEL